MIFKVFSHIFVVLIPIVQLFYIVVSLSYNLKSKESLKTAFDLYNFGKLLIFVVNQITINF